MIIVISRMLKIDGHFANKNFKLFAMLIKIGGPLNAALAL